MLPLRDPKGSTGRQDDLESIPSKLDPDLVGAAIRGWRLEEFRAALPGQHFDGLVPGTVWEIAGGDLVSSAPELARLTLNIAMVHHDARASAEGRLVYGGHTIGIAATQAAAANVRANLPLMSPEESAQLAAQLQTIAPVTSPR